MTAWRPIAGTITLLDEDLVAEKELQKIFAEERILGRGALAADNSSEFHIELAISGRKQRVATLDEQGEIFKGRSLENLVGYLHDTLRKVEITIAGKTLHGPIDIGAVDIDDAFDADSDLDSSAISHLADTASGNDDVPAEKPASDTRNTDMPAGRAFSLADIALSEIPVLAAAQKQQIGDIRFGELHFLLSEEAPQFADRAVLAPDFSLTFILQPAGSSRVADTHLADAQFGGTGRLGDASLFTDNAQPEAYKPFLIVNRMGRELRWDWSGELAPFEWTLSHAAATEFVRDELGAGGVAREAAADILTAPFPRVREALLVDPDDAAYALIDALSLPHREEVLSVLQGRRGMQEIPNIRIFEPRGAASTFTEALAWEVAGHGHINSRVADAFRTLYLERPWLTSMVAAMQAGAGGIILMNGLQKKPSQPRSLWKMGVGALLISNAISRIATAQYLNTALERFVGDGEARDEYPR